MLDWYLVLTKLRSEQKVKETLLAQHDLQTFFPVLPRKGVRTVYTTPLFPRYVFVHCWLERDFQKIQFAPGVTRLVSFGSQFLPVPQDVVDCLRARCDPFDTVLPPALEAGRKVRVRRGVFKGCEGIIHEKRGHRRVQLLLELAFGLCKVELDEDLVEVVT